MALFISLCGMQDGFYESFLIRVLAEYITL